MCVEVKNGPDTLSSYQQDTARDLTVHGMPVYERRPPDPYSAQPASPEGQPKPVCDVRRVMDQKHLPPHAASPAILAAADRAIAAAEYARQLAEARAEDSRRYAAAMDGKLKDARTKLKALQAEHDQLSADTGYLLRHILDCRQHYVTTRIGKLMQRYGEDLRSDIVPLPGGEMPTVAASGTGWPS